jgi:GNAT superfamily N-acetyltransferase
MSFLAGKHSSDATQMSFEMADRRPLVDFVASHGSDFCIDPATPEDVDEILAMIRELAQYERLEHLCVSTPADVARALFEPPSRVEVVVAREGGRAIGFALFFHNFSTFLGKPGLYLEDLFVRPQWRRKGYGRALLVHLARLAEARGCGRFEWSVLDWNEPAIRFYESLGASVLPDWRITRVTGEALARLAAAEDVPGPAPS